MKKIIVLLVLVFSLSSCFWSTDNNQVNDAKKELLWSWEVSSDSWNIDENVSDSWSVEDSNSWSLENKEKVSINYLDENKFIELDDLTWKDFTISDEIEITWKIIDKNVDKIEVKFSNRESSFPADDYILKTFKKWDESFKYKASKKFSVLDYGENIYEITAYKWKEISKVELIINIDKTDESNVSVETKDLKIEDFPTWWDFWNPIKIWTDSFSYSDLKSLEIKKQEIWNIDCENLNDYLSKNMKSYYYWNTCRNTVKDKWISFYITRLNWNNYVYEKHYLDNVHWLTWTFELEKWQTNAETKDTIQQRNDDLKPRNTEFTTSKIVDNLFVEIANK